MARITLTSAAIILAGMIHFLAGLGPKPVILLAGLLLPLLTYGLWTLLDSEDRLDSDLYLPGITAVSGILLGSLVRWATQPQQTFLLDLLALGLGAGTASAVIALRRSRGRSLCSICRAPLTSNHYQCPRCNAVVCARCWHADTLRCSDCERLRRPLFPLEDPWWQERLGRRVTHGQCIRCKRGASERDLRQCGKCQWAMCKECWDLENGRCLRCLWTMPGLPRSLRAYARV